MTRLLEDGRRQIIGFKTVGDFLGLTKNGLYATDAEAIDDVTVCQVPAKQFYSAMEGNNAIKTQLMEMMQREMTSLQDNMLLLGRKSPTEKIANFLYERLMQKFRYEGSQEEPNNTEITLPMSRADIADYLGLTIETVSRTFTKLRKLAMIELKTSQKVRITDLHQLQAQANAVGLSIQD